MEQEPDSAEAVAAWVAERMRAGDRFARVDDASERHREQHGAACTVYPSGSGPLLATLAAAVHAERVLEVGSGLGYSSLGLADGAGAGARIETIEHDPSHADLARAEIEREGFAGRVRVLEGDALSVLPTLAPGYGFIFWDGEPEGCVAAFEQLLRLLEPGGVLVTSNLFLAQYDPAMPASRRRRRTGSGCWTSGRCGRRSRPAGWRSAYAADFRAQSAWNLAASATS